MRPTIPPRTSTTVTGRDGAEKRARAGVTDVAHPFLSLINAPPGTAAVLLGNRAFALGVIHAKFGAAEGYPGTPSTEVIDTLLEAPEVIDAAWSVNEAVAVGVGVGRSLAGVDTVVTMKTPGLFQAADAVSSAAFYDLGPGALVLYIATDMEPSSTQNIVDPRPFLAASAIPVLEPRSHQELYEIPRLAAALSRDTGTPVAVLTSGVLAHSEGIVRLTQPADTKVCSNAPAKTSILLPSTARARYEKACTTILPTAEARFETRAVSVTPGCSDVGIIAVGAAMMAVEEAVAGLARPPHLMGLSGVFPLPKQAISAFAARCRGGLFVFEDGGRFVEEQLLGLGVNVTGKADDPSLTLNTPASVLSKLYEYGIISDAPPAPRPLSLAAVPRPPSICPGCPYRCTALVLQKLRKKGRLETVFGDIGCSTLFYYLDALDLNLCMGASESMRQGYVRSRPHAASKTISLIGDSGECHTGLDASRNAVFRNIPGVKVVLDNRSVAMTGGQPTPTTLHRVDLAAALSAEGVAASEVDAFDLTGIETALDQALTAADDGVFSAVVVTGACLQSVPGSAKRRRLFIRAEKCTRCGRCMVCPGIEAQPDGRPAFTSLCRNCGGKANVCVQRCRAGAIAHSSDDAPPLRTASLPVSTPVDAVDDASVSKPGRLPPTVRLAVRGVGGQGNLFFGKVLAKVFLEAASPEDRIIKGETHGMAQLGGPVISSFAFGRVHSPIFLPQTADVLVAMEMSEVLRPGFLALLKPGGTLILNRFAVVPRTMSPEDYPSRDRIAAILSSYTVLEIDAALLAAAAGDDTGRTINVAVIGLLSTLPPFSMIPGRIWRRALTALSKSSHAAAQNQKTFDHVRQHGLTNEFNC